MPILKKPWQPMHWAGPKDRAEIAFIHARESDCHVLLDQLAAGEIPLRVTHNDTKINNVLMTRPPAKASVSLTSTP